MERALVTGASGYVGSRAVREPHAHGERRVKAVRDERPARVACRAVSLAILAALCAPAIGTSSAAVSAPRAHAGEGACLVPGVGEPLDQAWRPDIGSAVAYVRRRQGDIAFAVRTAGAFYGYRPDHREWSASVLKAMLLVAYLDRPSVAGRALSAHDRSLLDPMITRSDNDAADTVDTIVGAGGLRALAARVGMTRFAPAEPIWGESRITARDQTRFFLHIDSHIAPRHRAYAMSLLASIVPSQRWGVGEVAPRGWKLYFKGGWGSGTGLIDNQVALLTRGCARVSIAVLTMHDGSHAYGKQTLEAVFRKLLAGLPSGPHARHPERSPALRHASGQGLAGGEAAQWPRRCSERFPSECSGRPVL